MKLTVQNFSSEYYRPVPLHFSDRNVTLLATIWGDKSESGPVLEEFWQRLSQNFQGDQFENSDNVIETLTESFKDLNVSLLKLNQNEWNTIVECICVVSHKSNVSYFSIGNHSVFAQDKASLIPISISTDYAGLRELSSEKLSPIPSAGLGIMESLQVQSGNIKRTPNLKLLVCSRSIYEPGDFIISQETVSLWHSSLATAQPEMPFWLAEVEL